MGFLDQRKDVSHAQDSRSHALGMEDLEALDLLGDADELDRHAGHMPHRKRGAAARVAVELGDNDAGQRQGIPKCAGSVDGVLALHGIHHEQRLDRPYRGVQVADLAHHRLVDGETPGRIDDDHVMVMAPRPIECRRRDGDGLLLRARREPVDLDLLGERAQLLDCRGTINVGAHDQNLFLAVPKETRKLCRGGRLAHALQSGEKNDRRRLRGEIERDRRTAHHGRELAVHYADQRLSGGERADDFRAERLGPHGGNEILDHRQCDVGFQECEPDLPQRILNIGFGQPRFAAQLLDDPAKTLSQIIEHDGRRMECAGRAGGGTRALM